MQICKYRYFKENHHLSFSLSLSLSFCTTIYNKHTWDRSTPIFNIEFWYITYAQWCMKHATQSTPHKGSEAVVLPRRSAGSAGGIGGHVFETHWTRCKGRLDPSTSEIIEEDYSGRVPCDSWKNSGRVVMNWTFFLHYNCFIVFLGGWWEVHILEFLSTVFFNDGIDWL